MGLTIDLIKGVLFHSHKWTDVEDYTSFPTDLIINGTLTVIGSIIQQSSILVSDVLIEDNIITLNNGEAGAGVTLGIAGIEIDRGSVPNSYLVYNETDDLWHYGFDGGADYVIRPRIDTIGISLDGQGGTISIGSYGYRVVEYAGNVVKWFVIGNIAGNIQFDIKRNGTSIIGAGNKPLLSAAQRNNAVPASWTSIVIVANDELEFIVDSSSVLTKAWLFIQILRT